MGRRKAFTQSELLDAVEGLLLENGYEGFHVKLLSEHLTGARSTIYQYFSNKEEMVAACMKRVMQRILEQTNQVDETDEIQALQQLLSIYLKEANLHAIFTGVNKITEPSSAQTIKDLEYIDEGHDVLKNQIVRLITLAQKHQKMRTDVPAPVLAVVFFQLIATPNPLQFPTEQWAELLFTIWFEGAQPSSKK